MAYKKLTSIVLVIPYFGKLPSYFDLFIESCKNNETINWLIITDNNLENIPSNIQVIKMNFDELKNIIREKLKLEKVNLEEPYKLCDYKPAYGRIFEDYLEKYDFWGHCDMDLVWGDIRTFITEDILNKYKKVFTHGHLSLYKNTPECNEYYALTAPNKLSFNEAIESKEIMYFDEIGIIDNLKYHKIPIYTNICFIDILPQYPNFQMLIDKNDKNHRKQVFYWEKGRLYKNWIEKKQENRKEYMYIHLQKRIFKYSNNIDLNKRIYINSYGFSNENQGNINNISHFVLYYKNWLSKISRIKIKRKLMKYTRRK